MQNTLKATMESLALVMISLATVVAYQNAGKAGDARLGYSAAAVQVEAAAYSATETSSDITIPSYGFVRTGDGGESELDIASLGGQTTIY